MRIERRSLVRRVNFKNDIEKLIWLENHVDPKLLESLRKSKDFDPDQLIRLIRQRAIQAQLNKVNLGKHLNKPATK